MSRMTAHQITTEIDDIGETKNGELVIAYVKPASRESVATVLSADVNSDDGRSNWMWVQLASGDWILGVYPQGDTYLDTEQDRERDMP